jgi:hypothetical protein
VAPEGFCLFWSFGGSSLVLHGGGAAGSQRIDAQELGHLPSKAGIGVKLWNENENEDSRSLREGLGT